MRAAPEEIFALVFKHLAEHPTDENRAFAGALWDEARYFDFCDWDLRCDEALVELGLAEPNPDGSYTYKERSY